MVKKLCVLFLVVCFLSSVTLLQAQEVKKDEPAKSEPVPEIKTISAFNYAALEMTGSYEQHETAYSKLYEEAAKQSLPQDNSSFGIYFNDPQSTPVENLKWDIGLEVPEGQALQEPLKMKKWEFTTVASLIYEGTFDDKMMAAYQKIFMWIDQNGYSQAGPLMEKSLNMPLQGENGVWSGKIEILIPVIKKP